MLPYTTYTIPDPLVNKTSPDGKWLLFISDREFSESQLDLVQKMGTALKATFENDIKTLFKSQYPNLSLPEMINPSYRLLISFGITPRDLSLWIDLETAGIRFLESFTFILTLPIPDLEKNANAKKELWKYMQMFLELNATQDG
jgi:hypothetical protein